MPAGPAPLGPAPLYERLGGEAGIRSLLVAFYGRVLADPDLKPFFIKTSMDKLLRMQEEFFGMALDGPHRYTGRELRDVHAGLGITGRHFHRFVQHLLETLQDGGAEADDIRDVVRRVNAVRGGIVG